MRFSILQLLIAVSAFGVLFGFAANYGTEPALVLAFSMALAAICIIFANRSWRKEPTFWRDIWTTAAVISCFLAFSFVVNIVTDPDYARVHDIRRLQREMNFDKRFSAVTVKFGSQTIPVLYVNGSVRNEEDFQSLRQIIRKRKALGIHTYYWELSEKDSGRVIHGRDDILFGH